MYCNIFPEISDAKTTWKVLDINKDNGKWFDLNKKIYRTCEGISDFWNDSVVRS